MARDSKKLEKRNTAIVARYKQLYDIERKRHDDVVKILSEEFFLSERTIFSVLFQGKNKHKKDGV